MYFTFRTKKKRSKQRLFMAIHLTERVGHLGSFIGQRKDEFFSLNFVGITVTRGQKLIGKCFVLLMEIVILNDTFKYLPTTKSNNTIGAIFVAYNEQDDFIIHNVFKSLKITCLYLYLLSFHVCDFRISTEEADDYEYKADERQEFSEEQLELLQLGREDETTVVNVSVTVYVTTEFR